MNQVLAGVFDFCVNGTNPLFVFSTLGNSQFFSVLMSQLSGQNIAILLTAESLQPKSIPTLPVPHLVVGKSLTVIQAYQLPRESCTSSQVLML